MTKQEICNELNDLVDELNLMVKEDNELGPEGIRVVAFKLELLKTAIFNLSEQQHIPYYTQPVYNTSPISPIWYNTCSTNKGK